MIVVKFTCHQCGLTDADCEVPERRPDEDILAWMNQVRLRVGMRHTTLSLLCECQVVDLRIPLPEDAEYVGQKGHKP